jgi:hypothetical protein
MAGFVPAMTEIVERSVAPETSEPPHPNSGVPGTKASKAAQNWER